MTNTNGSKRYSLVGKYFYSCVNDTHKGRIVAEVKPGWYVVELWIGEWRDNTVMPIKRFEDCTVCDCNDFTRHIAEKRAAARQRELQA